MTRVRLVCALAAACLALPAFSAAAPASHDIIYVTGADFFVVESSGAGAVELKRCCHGESEVTVNAATVAGTATPGDDYTSTSRTIRFTTPVEDADLEVPLVDDTSQESLETIEVELSEPSGNTTLGPHRGTIRIIDNDGPARFSFAHASVSIFENYGVMEFVVVRSGDPRPVATVSYATADGEATAGEDYEAASGTLAFDAGQRIKRFVVRMTNDRLEEGAEGFSVALSEPLGASLEETSISRGVIQDDETPASDTSAPVSYFHQPLHGKSYSPRAMRDILAFADDGGSGVKQVQVALMKKLSNGSCRWFSKRQKTFVAQPCADKLWMNFPTDETVIYTLPKKLRPSRGTNIHYYKAWARGIDVIGNRETTFDPNRNLSRFEIR